MAIDPAEPFCYLTTIGRVSGEPHTIEIWFGSDDGTTIYLLGGGRGRSDWNQNIQAQPKVTVVIQGTSYDATARILDAVADADEDALARRLLVEKYRNPNDDLAEWGRTAQPVALDLVV